MIGLSTVLVRLTLTLVLGGTVIWYTHDPGHNGPTEPVSASSLVKSPV
jgi:hypothetical protein